jgi:hypothetical protein
LLFSRRRRGVPLAPYRDDVSGRLTIRRFGVSQLDELKRVAEAAATQGPWRCDLAAGVVEEDAARPFVAAVVIDETATKEDIAFIATFNPETVKALLGVVEAAEAVAHCFDPYLTPYRRCGGCGGCRLLACLDAVYVQK